MSYLYKEGFPNFSHFYYLLKLVQSPQSHDIVLKVWTTYINGIKPYFVPTLSCHINESDLNRRQCVSVLVFTVP